MGPLWLDVSGYELTSEEQDILAHPTVGGVILFSRNYFDHDQLVALTRAIRQAAKRDILIGVDQEGGRVQRFRDGFTRLPPAQLFARVEDGESLAHQAGWLMAAELMAHDIDLSFAPVLDKGFDCKAIGNRSFGTDIDSVVRYSGGFLRGMRQAGMATTGKHFPGHGGVIADSHVELPVDERNDILEQDMQVFRQHILANTLDAIMPAHVVFSHYDDQPASGSKFWLTKILREQLNFSGVIFSDDLSMEGASAMGNVVERSAQALRAGCDMILVCNKPKAAIQVLDHLPVMDVPGAPALLKKRSLTLKELKSTAQWQQAYGGICRALDKT